MILQFNTGAHPKPRTPGTYDICSVMSLPGEEIWHSRIISMLIDAAWEIWIDGRVRDDEYELASILYRPAKKNSAKEAA